VSYSNFWSRSSDVVQVPPEKRRLPEQERRDARPRSLRPGSLRSRLHRHLSRQHGRHGGQQPQGKAGKELPDCADEQLHAMAVRADDQLQVHPAPSPLTFCEYCFDWMELLPELLE
jgi:hypothetical protein